MMDAWLSMRDVCEHLGLSRPAVQRFIDDRRLRPYRMTSGRLRFRPEDVEAFIASCRIEPGSTK